MPSPAPHSTSDAPAEDGAQPPADASFDELYRAHARTVARWAARLGGARVDPEETIQEVFLIVNRRLGEFRGEARVTTWLFRITARVVSNQRRAARRRAGLWERLTRRTVAETPSPDAIPGDALEQRQAAARFYHVLDGLPENQREALVLFELEEMTTEDIARLMDRPPATIRVWLHRARAQFTARWREEEAP